VSAALEQEASVFLKPYHHRCVFVSSISISFAKGQSYRDAIITPPNVRHYALALFCFMKMIR
jgi:hypothetical protein